jgi:hypothetical protein
MSKVLRLKIIGPTEIHGRRPGEEFVIGADDDGVPLDLIWRKRLDDERKFDVKAVTIIPVTSTEVLAGMRANAPAPVQPPVPASTPATPKKEVK